MLVNVTKVVCTSVLYFKWVEETSQFKEYLIKSYNKKRAEGYFLEADIQYLQTVLPERKKIEKFLKFVVNLHNQPEYVSHIKKLK